MHLRFSKVLHLRRIHCYLFVFVFLILTLGIGISRKSIIVNAPGDGTSNVVLPIIMYHQFTQSAGNCGKYVVTAAQFEADLLYLKQEGYHSITVAQLLAYVEIGRALPEKPIILTIDDGFASIYSYVFPLLQKHDMCAVVSLVGSLTELASQTDDHNPRYSYLTWAEAKEMADSGYVELQNHSWDLHKSVNGREGAKKKRGESAENYQLFLSEDLRQMQESTKEKTGYSPTAFAYPFGAWSAESPKILKQLGFKAAFTCEEKLNTIDLTQQDWLFRLRRFNRAHGKSSEAFFKAILPRSAA